MVDTKKEQEREELQPAIWAIADVLRGLLMVGTLRIMFLVRCFTLYFREPLQLRKSGGNRSRQSQF